ncbi:DMT family transporter [Microbacterium oryzae]|uniref:DMT family transporter n=1 Tax=Microbacterium oryzae TaxID=743009 RepID=UPI0025AF4345|nr:DMT family transporter [Microbacterium oryzae]MDN3309408.1 DMT family transporter [Microbacterium oryzae]
MTSSAPALPRVSTAGFILSALATVGAGIGMAVQGTANGALGGVLGHGLFAATVAFLVGLAILVVITLVAPSALAGAVRAWRLVRTGEFPWWMTLGGLAGATVVVSQAFTIPLMGVAVFTMAYIAGQLAGALVVDSTALPPGGRKPPTRWRVIGTLVVLVGVSLSAVGVLSQGIPLWAPVLPVVAGALTAFQQAFNGRLRMRAGSAIAANLTNFLTGSAFLVLCTIGLLVAGVRVEALPDLPADSWMLLGGALGAVFIGVTTVTVARLGVLLLSLMTLFGNLVGSLVIDLAFHSAHAEVNAMTFVSIAVVLVGVAITSIPAPARLK